MSDKYPLVYLDGRDFLREMSEPEGAPFKVVRADAIVIERESLHPVVALADGTFAATDGRGEWVVAASELGDNLESLYNRGIGLIAIAEHLREHPPVDEAEVERLTSLLVEADEAERNEGSWGNVARRLVAKGVRADGAR